MQKKIVVIGGGNGTATVLASLKSNPNYKLAGIVGMADNGGTNGVLRGEYGVSAVSDIRNCLAGLCDDENLKQLFSYRFGSGQLKGYGFGSMYLAAAELMTDDIFEAIGLTKKALNIKADVIPVTLTKPQLKLSQDNKEYFGVYEIVQMKLKTKPRLSLKPESKITPQATKAISEADLIIIAPGNFYCSIAQVFVVKGMKEAIENTNAKIIQITNLINLNKHCEGFRPLEYTKELERIMALKFVDAIIYNTGKIEPIKLREDESPVPPEVPTGSDYELIGADMVSKDVKKADPNDSLSGIRSMINHDKQTIAQIVKQQLEKI